MNSWKNYTIEFLSVFVAVISAFALNNWNDNRRDSLSEEKILKEIKNGLQLDLQDIQTNKWGHNYGVRTCQYFRDLIDNKPVAQDSIKIAYVILLRDFTSIMNLTGYESLKSKGLEIIRNDTIRLEVIALYDYYYQIMYKLEESATEMQSFSNYFSEINEALYPYMEFDQNGELMRFNQPIQLTEQEKKRIFSYLWRIQNNRLFKLNRYALIEEKIEQLVRHIDEELDRR
ncbi:MAG: hypothetical protein AAFX87_28380 [Bacteroidota bacterium]